MYQYRIQQLLVFETEKSEVGGMIINPILLKILFFLIKEVYINMELRLLRYFLTVAKEQSFTKAAEQLHITQPTLSRQMAAFEEELGVTLFIRSGKKISLTDEGILLKRRALEILNLEEKTLEELKGKEDVVEGNITIGCGEFAAVETLAEICKTYKEKYPLVQIVLHTATADAVYEMMNKGIVDIALFMEPVDTEGMDYIRITDCDHWCVGMRPDDPLAEKEFIKKEDLIGKPLILPERVSVQSELANWFGKDFSKLQIAFTSNLGTNAGVMAANGLGYPVSIEGAAKYWREDILVQRRISPEITTSTVIAWRRNIPYSLAVSKMIEEINAFQA
jgi:DNA-binding transcriptional LysR family regulator